MVKLLYLCFALLAVFGFATVAARITKFEEDDGEVVNRERREDAKPVPKFCKPETIREGKDCCNMEDVITKDDLSACGDEASKSTDSTNNKMNPSNITSVNSTSNNTKRAAKGDKRAFQKKMACALGKKEMVLKRNKLDYVKFATELTKKNPDPKWKAAIDNATTFCKSQTFQNAIRSHMCMKKYLIGNCQDINKGDTCASKIATVKDCVLPGDNQMFNVQKKKSQAGKVGKNAKSAKSRKSKQNEPTTA